MLKATKYVKISINRLNTNVAHAWEGCFVFSLVNFNKRKNIAAISLVSVL